MKTDIENRIKVRAHARETMPQIGREICRKWTAVFETDHFCRATSRFCHAQMDEDDVDDGLTWPIIEGAGQQAFFFFFV